MPRPPKPTPETRWLPAQRKAIVSFAGATVEITQDGAGFVTATVDEGVHAVEDGKNGPKVKDKVPKGQAWEDKRAERAAQVTAEDRIRDKLDRALPHNPNQVSSREELVQLAAAEVAAITQQEAPK